MPSFRPRRRDGVHKSARVLQISDDQNLAVTRLLILHNQHYSAEHLYSRQLADFPEFAQFDLYLICQSIVPEEARGIIARIRREAPLARILRVRTVDQEDDEDADLSLAPPAGPYALIKGLQSLAQIAIHPPQ